MITKLTYWNRTKLSVGLCLLGGFINISRQHFEWSLWLNPLSLLLIMAGLVGCLLNISTYNSVNDK